MCCSHVLLMDDGHAKLGDVGFSRLRSRDTTTSMGNRIGTFDFCAPEVLLGRRASYSADIYRLVLQGPAVHLVVVSLCCSKLKSAPCY